ncbi:MAG: hypothetical protein AAB922_00990, partial [Patescibacteria group bacterium]
MASVFFPKIKKKHIKHASRVFLWFSIGAVLSLFLISSFSYFAFQNYYKGKVYPGVRINRIDFGKKTAADVNSYFLQKNKDASDITFVFSYQE